MTTTTPLLLPLPYLQHYPKALQDQIRTLISQDKLADYMTQKYPNAHTIQSDGALYEYVIALKNDYMRQSVPLHRVSYDSTISVKNNALGLNTAISRVQGGKLTAKKEIRIASLFKKAPAEFLKMIAVHELAHLKYRDHDKGFYQLCHHIEPAYSQLEFDLRVYLTLKELQSTQHASTQQGTKKQQ